MLDRVQKGEPLGHVRDENGIERPVTFGHHHHGLPGDISLKVSPEQYEFRHLTGQSPPREDEAPPHDPHLSPPMLSSDTTASEGGSPVTPNRNLFTAFREGRPTSSPAPDTTQTAKQLKRSYSAAQGRGPSGKRLTGENDPENREILRLRQEEQREFDDIANILNKKRVKTGVPPNLTANAIYSRYKRNGPLIAASDGKEFVPTELDKKANGSSISFKKATPIVGFDAHEDELLVMAVTDIEAKKWDLVAARLEELGGKRHDSEMCALRFNRL
ncbi:MAG: hypothetical protein Q9217_001307 [Psora testacea]